MIKLLITDLDDTLYSWIGFFIPAFYAMVDELSILTKQDKQTILDEYKAIHQEKGSVEYPYATKYLPTVKKTFPNAGDDELNMLLNSAFHRFNSVRKQKLNLYPHVRDVLQELHTRGIKIVAYTESAEENGFYRLKKLGIDEYFEQVYVAQSQFSRPNHFPSSPKTTTVVGKKPNPALLTKICSDFQISESEAVYMGDSNTKDIYMAKKAGITAILCKHPSPENIAELYQKLVAISHWTKEDFARESTLKEECQVQNITPDYILSDFQELLKIIDDINANT